MLESKLSDLSDGRLGQSHDLGHLQVIVVDVVVCLSYRELVYNLLFLGVFIRFLCSVSVGRPFLIQYAELGGIQILAPCRIV